MPVTMSVAQFNKHEVASAARAKARRCAEAHAKLLKDRRWWHWLSHNLAIGLSAGMEESWLRYAKWAENSTGATISLSPSEYGELFE